jgi:hypothetical protein
MDLVMNGADIVGGRARSREIRRSLEPDGEGVEARPPGLFLSTRLDALRGELLRDRGDDGTVEPTREEDPVGDVAHQLSLDRLLERVAKLRDVRLRVLDRAEFHPIAGVPSRRLSGRAVVYRAGEEFADFRANPLERLELARDVETSLGIPSLIQGDDPDVVATDEVSIPSCRRGRSEDTVQVLEKIGALLAI